MEGNAESIEIDASNKNEFTWLKQFAPEFKLCGDRITVLFEPKEFYSNLIRLLDDSTHRVAIASLYIGTGILEQQLITILENALTKSENKIRVHILLDYTRSSRGTMNSRVMLLPLLNRSQEDEHEVQVALYHTPDLRGLLKRFLPDRWNEGIGLAHMKIYVVDDTVIISGANLSNDYFTNRQDRYVMFEDEKLASFFESLVQTVSTFSLQLQKNNSLKLHKDWLIHPYEGNCSLFKSEAKKTMEMFIKNWMLNNPVAEVNKTGQLDSNIAEHKSVKSKSDCKLDTTVYPLLQMGPLGINYDSSATERMLMSIPANSNMALASGYFNLTSRYVDLILDSPRAKFSIFTASPKANGFFGGKGISGSIPKLYTYVARLFYEKVIQRQQTSRITLFEYERPDWTFHSKGLWCNLQHKTSPAVTFVGSPNFGYRSVHRDLEAQVAIVTKNQGLKQLLILEQHKLFLLSLPVTSQTFNLPERYVPLWVKLFTKAFKNFF